jgi:hypothetical protein
MVRNCSVLLHSQGIMKSKTLLSVVIALLTAGVALAAPVAAQGPAGPERLRGSLSFQGPAGEFISGGTRVSLPSGTPVTVAEPNSRSLELKFATRDGWELDLAVSEKERLAAGTYNGAARYPFQKGNEPGLSLLGACEAVAAALGNSRLVSLSAAMAVSPCEER